MKKKTLVILNTITLVAVLFINYLAASGAINNQTVGEISSRYETLFTPAGYAFSIWGIIYFGLILFTGFQWSALIRKNDLGIIDKTGFYFIVTNLANTGWLFLWLFEYPGLSVIAMIILFLTLIKIIKQFDMEIWDAPVRIIFFVWWPFAIYFGWIITALTANIAAYFTYIGWKGSPLNPEIWTIILIVLAAVIYIILIFKRNLRESAAVGVWALIAIAVKQGNEKMEITAAAILAAAVILVFILYHGFKNRETAPIKKLMRGEF